jgi:hypothetical protein
MQKTNKFRIGSLKAYIGIFLLLTSIILIFYWENYGRETFVYVDVPVLNSDIEANTIITQDLITLVKMEENKVIEGSVGVEKVIGKETKHFLPKNAQLHEKYFDVPQAVLKEGQFIFAVPREWIIACPGSLRRKDRAYFYTVKSPKLLQENKVYSFDDTVIPDINEIDLSVIEELIVDVTVAYVKDSSNREVVTVSSEERYDGLSVINQIEIIATNEEIDELRKAYEQGYQFVIMYK